jgi:hypothetical protein
LCCHQQAARRTSFSSGRWNSRQRPLSSPAAAANRHACTNNATLPRHASAPKMLTLPSSMRLSHAPPTVHRWYGWCLADACSYTRSSPTSVQHVFVSEALVCSSVQHPLPLLSCLLRPTMASRSGVRNSQPNNPARVECGGRQRQSFVPPLSVPSVFHCVYITDIERQRNACWTPASRVIDTGVTRARHRRHAC